VRRFAVVGTGARAETFIRSLVTNHADRAELVALADVNPARIQAHNRWLGELGHSPVPGYPAEDFGAMLDNEKVDAVIVTTVDATHERYIVAALGAGRDVITEKPMTVDAESCTRILRAAKQSPGSVAVAFNYRYNPVHERVREVLAAGEVGEVGSVHFEWMLDVRHGADYFRRWHRDRTNSGGLLVHKSSHHFDLVNWWLGARPVEVYAQNRLFFYGMRGGRAHGYDRGYDRATGSAAADGDPFALDLTANPRMRELYYDAEGEDGYLRDRNVFADGVSIDDDMAVLVRYDTGATMTYHLTAYAPWEGYRLMVNGSRGRLELEVVETDQVILPQSRVATGAAGTVAGLYPGHAGGEAGWSTLTLRPYWSPPRPIDLPEVGGGTTGGGDPAREAHGGGDERMTAMLFSGDSAVADPLGRRATEVDGAWALLTGLAANASARERRPVAVSELVDPSLLSEAKE
jgi:predicted dehydrogenase